MPEVEEAVEMAEEPNQFEEMTATIGYLQAENEALKAQLSEQPVVEEAPVVEEPAAKPISHNPEKQTAAPQFTFGANRKETTMDRILNKLAN
jgi:hypothetical protein